MWLQLWAHGAQASETGAPITTTITIITRTITITSIISIAIATLFYRTIML